MLHLVIQKEGEHDRYYPAELPADKDKSTSDAHSVVVPRALGNLQLTAHLEHAVSGKNRGLPQLRVAFWNPADTLEVRCFRRTIEPRIEVTLDVDHPQRTVRSGLFGFGPTIGVRMANLRQA